MISQLRTTLAARGFSTDLDEEAAIDMVVRRHGSPRATVYLQERHVSQAFQEALSGAVPASERLGKLATLLDAQPKATDPDDAVTIQNDLRTHLLKAGKPAFVEESFLSLDQARRLILELGGIPCYPTLLDGTSPLCPLEADPDRLIAALRGHNVHAAEWILPRNATALTRKYVIRMRAAGLVQTAGTEHNTLELIPIAPTCSDGPMPPDLQAIFWEGACVAAAHQFLTLHGECGYVDGAGNPNPAYATADQRIRDLARLGAAVIGRYQEVCSPSQPITQ
jgi:hypothetical protein